MHTITTLDAGAPDTDLDFLEGRLACARVIGLGEATHGTSEFYRFRHRIIRYLVERAGCRLIGLEAGWAETLALQQVVFDGSGDAAAAVANLGYWMWDVWEFRALIDWLQAFNANRSPADRVGFFGFDALSGAAAVDLLFRLLGPHGNDLPPACRDLLHECRSLQAWQAPNDAIEAQHITRDLERLPGVLQPIPLDDPTRHLALEAIALLQRVDRRRRAELGPTSWNARDAEMASSILRELERQPSTGPMVVLAHNAHVAKDGQGLFAPDLQPMGVHLAERLGDRYLSIGQMFGHGSFQAMVATGSGGYRLDEVVVDTPPSLSLDGQLLRATEGKTAWVDAHDQVLQTGPDGLLVTRECGALFETEVNLHLAISVITRHDALVFSPVTTGTRSTPSGRRG
jgi:erythromycin esterase